MAIGGVGMTGRICRASGAALLATVLLGASACGRGPAPGEGGAADDGAFDATSLVWEPDRLEAAMPALVGWRYATSGASGELTVISADGEGESLWRPPAAGAADVRVEEVAPDGSQMVGVAFSAGDDPEVQWLHFLPDGSARSLPLPAGFDDVVDVAFSGERVLVLAQRATKERLETRVGLVTDEGTWEDVEIRGELPEHHFVESLAAQPGSDIVGVVLKAPGGTGDRDDDALVLTRRDGAVLDSYTPPFWDDALPGAQSLWDAEGVVYARWWNMADGTVAPVIVCAEWSEGAWRETVLSEPGALVIPLEMGEVVAQESAGSFLVRAVNSRSDDPTSELARVRRGSTDVEQTGADVTAVQWYTWVERSVE